MGYTSGNYFAVKASYASDASDASNELRRLVERLHKNGMECIVEMYFPDRTDHNLILDALRYWVMSFHVDGFKLLGDRLPVTAIVQDALLSRTKILYDALICRLYRKTGHMKISILTRRSTSLRRV